MKKDQSKKLAFPVAEVPLGFTGERYTTQMGGEVEQEHRHRYLMALAYCEGKRVLDIASGEGYGSAMLATVAGHVTGVDIDEDAIRHAQDNYGHDKLEYIQGSATAIPMADNSVDVLVSFETIEHFYGHDAFISEIRRVLVPGGLVIMSSPNKEIYSTTHGAHNEFHVSELTRQEFWDLLSGAFANTRSLQQKATACSVIVPDEGWTENQFAAYRLLGGGEFEREESTLPRGVYSIIFASDGELPPLAEWGVLEDDGFIGKLAEIIKHNEGVIQKQGEIVTYNEGLIQKQGEIITYNEGLIHDLGEVVKYNEGLIHDLGEVVKYNEGLIEERDTAIAKLRDELAEANLFAESAKEALKDNARVIAQSQTTIGAQQIHISNVERQLVHKESVLKAIYGSTSWRVTAPIRGVRKGVRFALRQAGRSPSLLRRSVNYVRRRGVVDAAKALFMPGKLRSWYRLTRDPYSANAGDEAEAGPGASASIVTGDRKDVYSAAVPEAAGALLAPRVVISAELSIPQCKKYRVLQKVRHFEHLGIPVEAYDWWRKDEVLKALQTATIIIFYRVPGYPEQLEVIEEARRLGVTTMWEVDDLIFDEPAYLTNSNLDKLEPDLRKSVLDGVPVYRAALQAVDYGIASTSTIADYMREAGVKDAFVVENCLDFETLTTAERIRNEFGKKPDSDTVRIIYGSGTKTHDIDFTLAAPGLARVMEANPNVVLEIIGELNLPDTLEPYFDRVVRKPFSNFPDYLATLAQADISLAPLEMTLFSDAKSNIKYLEASVLGLPSVCSATKTFREVIENGVTGYAVSTDEEWEAALTELVRDKDKREAMGQAALASVLENYSPHHIAEAQVAPIVSRFDERQDEPLKVLVANVFYAPRSFGGATIVAEEVVSKMADDPDLDFLVFTSLGEDTHPYARKRYFAKGVDCLGVKIPAFTDRAMEYENLQMQDEFRQVLESYRPDIVHFHCVQEISASIMDACIELGIPYVITLHDTWWLCERHFMVKSDNKYCFQEQIDLNVCRTCVDNFGYTVLRRAALKKYLDNAALLLAPSEFLRSLYISNGVDPERIRLNKNGVRVPEALVQKTPRKGGKIRFAYVGGDHPVKGVNLVSRAFSELEEDSKAELLVVDNTLNLGFSSFEGRGGNFPGFTTFVPAYNQETIDEFFAGVDVLVFPSQCKEAFGLTVREALSRNVWVISTDSGGVVEDIMHGVNGTIIPLTGDGDHVALRDAVQAILDHPEKLEKYENPHRDQIVTFGEQAEELRGILKEVAADHARPESVADASEHGQATGKELHAAE
ncbi:glycosyltransferase [uncultured Hyphomonas sp.]|uniref:glycosyltransferase n=1 Tax=uncultured Hyphomonas sp. TaxID=225298 RepID=UPI002AAB1127|nr:glycosyltransferase [uncultured Hyphomonas sp.]